jgi:hypothetical protein
LTHTKARNFLSRLSILAREFGAKESVRRGARWTTSHHRSVPLFC